MSVCGRQKGNLKRSQSAVAESESSMHFWGICCESGKHYNQVVGQRFRVTMAVLDPTSFQNDASERIVSLIVLRDGIEYLLCVLKHDEIHQVSLNLVFDKGENVRFYIKGQGNVYLSGYQLTGSEEDILNDENGYLCPLVEVKTKNKKKVSTSMELLNDDIEMKSKKRSNSGKVSLAGSSASPSWSALLNQTQDDEDDESDEDFTLSDEEFESDEVNTSDEMEDLEDEDELSENELDNESDAEEIEEEIILNSRGSQKRRKQEKMLPEKRSKKGSLNNSSNSVAEDVICIDDDEDDDSEYESDSGNKDTSSVGMKSSFGSPSKSKKETNMEVASNEKKSKKKKKKDKKLNDISVISGTSANSPNQCQKLNSTVDESTPYRSGSQPSQKLKGGIVVHDLTVGRGPLAIEGKTVHVFYVGRFSDKKIFDSRVPGAGKKPFSFKLGAGQVIKGWDLGLVGMRVGGKRKLKIPPKMGYGSQQHPDIPPDSTLYFVVELIAVS